GVPEHPGPLPDDATLETRSLHVAQAIDLCYQVYLDEDAAAPDRAVALCWVLHLVGDLHQPCHAGSLYAEGVFPGGDRGANSLKLVGGGNLHATWDGLLGGRATPGLIRKRVAELRNEVKEARRNRGPLTPGVWRNWCAHSIELAQTHVYTREVLKPIQLAQRGLIEEMPTYRLSQAYFQNAGKVARKQAAFAGVRLSSMLKLPIESRP
ncbi:MAG: S1/P1 nuclease, partial [Planctomycetota bacterium]